MSAFHRCAVVGAGLMGTQIAVALAAGVERVQLFDSDADSLDRAFEVANTYVDELAAHDFLAGQSPTERLGRIVPSRDLETALDGADLVVEAIFEDVAAKQGLFKELDAIAPPTTILASNSSSIPTGQIASVCEHLGRVVGTHFLLPAHILPLVEVIRHADSDADCVDRTFAGLQAAGKSPIRVNLDVPGFVSNRLQHALTRQAIELVARGVASAEDVDNAVRHGFGLRLTTLGPLGVRDISDIRVHARVAENMYADLDAKEELAVDALREHVRRGNHGISSGQGFFEWTGDRDAVRAYHYEHMIEQTRRVMAAGPIRTGGET
jgi:3-hydroxybutyryl-CoA dehydrogenase